MAETPAPPLSDLHDLVLPDPVPFWPPAPGAWVLLALAGLGMGIWAWRRWTRIRANLYRREALSALEGAADAAGIAAVLRRCARVELSPDALTALGHPGWIDFLTRTGPRPPESVAASWQQWVYAGSTPEETEIFRTYARFWVKQHQFGEPD